ncbi:MAG TPA: radical SAM family heme chaperone HemW [Chloroflexota bacterium]|nr:radical SAM family heme chaperone HemW [Chloroflexota bacterium]
MSRELAVYVHIPFCHYHCSFCDFATVTGQSARIPAYIEALIAELALRLEQSPRPLVSTVFFGGGTPSAIDPTHIHAIMDALRASCILVPNAEITLEANPGDHPPGFWEALRATGITRVSVGVQSLDDAVLRGVGRLHTGAEALHALRAVRRAGFVSVNADLMFGLPRQTLDQWRHTLDAVLTEQPDHLSVYGLILEPRTLLERRVRQGADILPSDDDAAAMYEAARELLSASGYVHYEISNWARPGHHSRHNLTYWRHDPYLGLGMGAHSYVDNTRFANLRGLRPYLARLAKKQLPTAHHEPIDAARARADAAMLGLRLVEGIDLAAFDQRFGGHLAGDHAEAIERFAALGLLEIVAGRLRLTPRGFLLANQIWQEFI